jgi:Family of unknown function (DUF5985)
VIVVTALCALASLACAALLARAWVGNRLALLFWCLVCFAGLALNNALLLVDEASDADLDGWRQLPAALGVGALAVALALRSQRR